MPLSIPPLIPWIIGLVASIMYPASYLFKKRRDIIIINVISRLLFVLQYLLLGAFSGAVLDVLGAVASLFAQKKEQPFIKKHTKLIITVIDVITLLVGLAVCYFEGSLLGLLSVAGVIIHTGALWLTDEGAIRRLSLLGSPFWFAYNLASRAYGSAVGDVLTVTSIVVAMIKYRKKTVRADESLTKEDEQAPDSK